MRTMAGCLFGYRQQDIFSFGYFFYRGFHDLHFGWIAFIVGGVDGVEEAFNFSEVGFGIIVTRGIERIDHVIRKYAKEGIEFIYYDQLDSYYSDQPNDSSLWTTDHFVEEVEQVRQALGLNKDNFYLLGHSWGVLRSKMRKSLVDSLQSYEAKGLYKDSVYQSLVINEYYNQHLCRVVPWPDPVNRMFKHLSEGIYVTMQGPSEFKTGGRLIQWDRSKELATITVPTLTIGGEFDTMDPKYMEWMSKQVKRGSYVYCPEGSHCDM